MDQPLPDTLVALIDWIERHLDDALTLDAIAAQTLLSPHHFSRLFTARMGRSVMAHVRGRRLVRAGHRLARDPTLRLIDVALDCGFGSQEAFTRAFRRVFGVAPGRFREGFAVTPIEGQYPMSMPVTQSAVVRNPGLIAVDEFAVAGPARRFDGATKVDIPHLWSQLLGALPFAGQVDSWATYGVMSRVDCAEGSFEYIAGVAVAPGSTPPAGFVVRRVPAATYAVFRITLTGGPLHAQVKAAMGAIWGRLIPEAGLTVADGPDFERYDGATPPTIPGAVIDFHVPVVA